MAFGAFVTANGGAQILNAAVGPPGPVGATGSKGDRGDTGNKGDTGQQGIQGVQGIPGVVGPVGPVPFGPGSPWVSGQSYVVGPPASYVGYGGVAYVCLKNHISSTFSNDLAAGNWFQQTTQGPPGPAGPGSGNVINTGTSGVGNIPKYTDTTGTAQADSGVAISSLATTTALATTNAAIASLAAITLSRAQIVAAAYGDPCNAF
jgi:hypothetical protein